MEQWIPVIQSFFWPLVVAGALIWLRSPISRIINAVAARIERGDSFEATPTGLKMGPSQPLASLPTSALAIVGQGVQEMLVKRSAQPELYLVHRYKRDPKLDRGGTAFFQLVIWLDADEDQLLDAVASVTYILHSSFRDPVRHVTDRGSKFAVNTSTWGEFNVRAEIKFADSRQPLHLERYLNLSN